MKATQHLDRLRTEDFMEFDDIFALAAVMRRSRGISWREVLDRSGLDFQEFARWYRNGCRPDAVASLWMLQGLLEGIGVSTEELVAANRRLKRAARTIAERRFQVDYIVHQFLIMKMRSGQPLGMSERESLRLECLGRVVERSGSTVRVAARQSDPRKIRDVAQIWDSRKRSK